VKKKGVVAKALFASTYRSYHFNEITVFFFYNKLISVSAVFSAKKQRQESSVARCLDFWTMVPNVAEPGDTPRSCHVPLATKMHGAGDKTDGTRAPAPVPGARPVGSAVPFGHQSVCWPAPRHGVRVWTYGIEARVSCVVVSCVHATRPASLPSQTSSCTPHHTHTHRQAIADQRSGLRRRIRRMHTDKAADKAAAASATLRAWGALYSTSASPLKLFLKPICRSCQPHPPFLWAPPSILALDVTACSFYPLSLSLSGGRTSVECCRSVVQLAS